jgi:uncharacterized damage-inducible protein DinB
VYWAPGCTGCLRMKEFLVRHGVPFVSINALEDEAGFDELAKLGVRRVPIAARGNEWVDGQVLKDLARIAGISLDSEIALAPAELVRRGASILSAALRLLSRIPESELDVELPSRPRSYKQLGCHILQIFEVFVDLAETGRRVEFEDYLQPVPDHVVSGETLQAYGEGIRRRFEAWRERASSMDFSADADVYYGKQTLHEFLERSVWHAAQHTRQVEAVLQKLGVSTDDGLDARDLAGLPMPENVYDDTIMIR